MGSGSTKLPWRRSSKEPLKIKANIKSKSFAAADVERKENGIHRAMTDGMLSTEHDFKADHVTKTDKNSNDRLAQEKTSLKISDLALNHLDNGVTNGVDSTELTPPPLSARKFSDAKILKYRNSITSSELYNLIIAETWQGHTQIHDAGYMLLIDCREMKMFETLHIVTSRHHSALYSEYGLLLPAQLARFNIIILYGNSPPCGDIHEISKKLADDEIEHYVLQSGVKEFFTRYPFLSTQRHFLTSDVRNTLQTMPSEILPRKLYQGNAKHALDPYIISSLGITHIVNVTLEHPNKFEDSVKYLRIQLDDRPQVDLHAWLPKTSDFIETAINDSSQHGVVLVHCNLGRSRSSTVVLGYLMQARKMSLGQASELLKDCRNTVRPNFGFLEQLLKYEKEVLGESVTQLNDLPF